MTGRRINPIRLSLIARADVAMRYAATAYADSKPNPARRRGRHREVPMAQTPFHLREPVRAWILGLLTPVLAILVFYGVMDANGAVLWGSLAVAVFGVTGTEIARSRVSPVPPAGMPPDRPADGGPVDGVL